MIVQFNWDGIQTVESEEKGPITLEFTYEEFNQLRKANTPYGKKVVIVIEGESVSQKIELKEDNPLF